MADSLRSFRHKMLFQERARVAVVVEQKMAGGLNVTIDGRVHDVRVLLADVALGIVQRLSGKIAISDVEVVELVAEL